MRNFFIENALHWFQNYHIDALRLDAIHAIFDFSAKHFLQELAERVEAFSNQQGTRFYLIAESDLNDARVIRPKDVGGYAIHAQWCDDFHHSLRTMLTDEREGYYVDFGRLEYLEKAFKRGFVYAGQYSQFRKRRHGNDASDRPAHQFVVCSQNHDQVGNRMLGERLSTLVPFEALKLAAGAVLLSPYIPLLFMGEEYGEEAPFLYFVDHSDPELIKAVREGRRAEFRSFEWQGNPPDPKSEETFLRSRLRGPGGKDEKQNTLREFYRQLLRHRHRIPAIANLDNKRLEMVSMENERLLLIRRWKDDSQIFYALNFNDIKVRFQFPFGKNQWEKVLDSSDERWLGPGPSLPTKLQTAAELTLSPLSCALYESVH